MKHIILILLLACSGLQAQFIGTAMYSKTAVAYPLLDSLFAYYPLNEASGNALDTLDNIDLTATGVTYGVSGILKTCYTIGNNNSLETASSGFEFTDNFSISWWAKTGAVGDTYEALVDNYGPGGASGHGYDIIMHNTGTVYANFRWNSGSIQLSKGGLSLEDDNWHHFVITCAQADDDSVKLYIDHVLEDDGKLSSDIVYSSCEFGIGMEPSTDSKYWDGEIDEVAIWQGIEVSHAQVDSLFNSGSAWGYPFDPY
jgi:hypothetical protein